VFFHNLLIVKNGLKFLNQFIKPGNVGAFSGFFLFKKVGPLK